MATENAVDVAGVSVAYEQKPVLRDIHWHIPAGTLAAIIGPNGGGKSTLLKSLVGMVQPQSGQVRLFGETPHSIRGRVAYLPQAEEVDWSFPISCLEVVLQGRTAHRRWWQRNTRDDRELAIQALTKVNMQDFAYRAIGALSGGQKQRVFIARALAQNAELVIMDEPGTGLDSTAQHGLLDLFGELKAAGHTVVITTHDLNCLAEHFDLVLGLNETVQVAGPPREVLTADVVTSLFSKHFPIITEEGGVKMHARSSS